MLSLPPRMEGERGRAPLKSSHCRIPGLRRSPSFLENGSHGLLISTVLEKTLLHSSGLRKARPSLGRAWSPHLPADLLPLRGVASFCEHGHRQGKMCLDIMWEKYSKITKFSDTLNMIVSQTEGIFDCSPIWVIFTTEPFCERGNFIL